MIFRPIAAIAAVVQLCAVGNAWSKDSASLSQEADMPRVAAVCTSPPLASVIPGVAGAMVSRCSSMGDVYGAGNNVSDAAINAIGFVAVADEGVKCTMQLNDAVTSNKAPGIGIKAFCNGRQVAAYGKTATVSASNVLAIAEHFAATTVSCNAGYYSASIHGFLYPYDCARTGAAWSVAGLGSSIDDANAMALRLMVRSTPEAAACRFDKAELAGVIFRARLTCGRSSYVGVGSTVTAAANDAAAQAGA